MATFDFPIYKDEAVVKREQDSILAAFQPYFPAGQRSMEKSALAKLKADYHAHLKGHYCLPPTTSDISKEASLKYIARASFRPKSWNQLHQDSTTAIMVINDKYGKPAGHQQGKLFTVKDAYELYTPTADTAHYSPDILRQCSLNEYLFPNLTYDEQRTETARKRCSTTIHGPTASY